MTFFTETILTASYDAKLNVLRQLIEMGTNILDNYEGMNIADYHDPDVNAHWSDEFINVAIDYRAVYATLPFKVGKGLHKKWCKLVDRYFRIFPV